MEIKLYPEVMVSDSFLERDEIEDIEEDREFGLLHITYESKIFGYITETFLYDEESGYLILKSVTPHDYQSFEEITEVKKYYNDFLLEGNETYLEYFNKEIGWYLLTRND